jgi:hypothetical protein
LAHDNCASPLREPTLPELPLRSVAVIARETPAARAVLAHLCDAAVSCRRFDVTEIDGVRSMAAQAVVFLTEGCELAQWLPGVLELYAQQPPLGLVVVGGRRERAALWRSFEDMTAPPLVLREGVQPAAVADALTMACELGIIQHLQQPLAATGSFEALQRKVAELVEALGSTDPPRDHYFDRFLPIDWRVASIKFWTPLEVVKRAAHWLDELGVRSVVDIGSGVGKFCIAGALSSSCAFIGVEQRPHLATVARNLSRVLGVDGRVTFVDGRFGEMRTPSADCYYLYNPFEENLFPVEEALDGEVELNPSRFRRDLRSFRSLVASLPLGAHVLTYNGVGGRFPDCLEQRRVDRELPAALRLFQKERL